MPALPVKIESRSVVDFGCRTVLPLSGISSPALPKKLGIQQLCFAQKRPRGSAMYNLQFTVVVQGVVQMVIVLYCVWTASEADHEDMTNAQ